MPDRAGWLTGRPIGLALACAGLVGLLVSGGMLFVFWHARWIWLVSEEHQRFEHQVQPVMAVRAEPARAGGESLAGVDAGRTSGDAARVGTPALGAAPAPHLGMPVRPPGNIPPQRSLGPPSATGRNPILPQRRAVPSSGTLEVVEAYLRLLALPQPGAGAVLGVTLRNRANAPSRPIVVSVSAVWFEHYSIVGAVPPVLDDRAGDDGYRHFEFPGAAPGADVALELHVSTVGETARAPTVRLSVQGGESLGEVRPEMVAEGFPLGPVRALSVPRLDIRTEVVDTAWEPPPFVAGQIGTTAALGEGNAVLVGHRGGLAGDVFKPLAGARRGDEVVAASHGVERHYIVSEIRILPNHVSTPLGPSETPRLTLMTCIGAWNPLTGDYSHRLWVTAEPPDLARETLAATVARASQTATRPADPAEAARAYTDAALARAALAVMAASPRGHP
jgi:LPXTG-site transpeptidase (sortase) family protein